MVCWGSGRDGLLGTEALRTAGLEEIRLPGPAASLALCAGAACAATPGGAVACWGSHEALGTGEQGEAEAAPRPATALDELSGASAVSCSAQALCALRATGGLVCLPPLAPPAAELGTVRKLALGDRHACALLADRTVRCWGDDGYGQLGGRRAGAQESMVQPPLTEVVDLAVGSDHTGAVRQDGAVLCWGRNERGQLGVSPTRGDPTRPAAISWPSGGSGPW